VIVNADEDTLTIDGKRKLLTRTGDAGAGQEDAFIRRAKEGMDTQEEATFAVEAPVTQQVRSSRFVVSRLISAAPG